MTNTVAKNWLSYKTATMSKEELKKLQELDEGRVLYMARAPGSLLVMMPVTRNGWAYKALAAIRGQKWPEGAESIPAQIRMKSEG